MLLGGIFVVYLLGCVITPMAGRFLDHYGFRRTAWLSVSATVAGLALMLAPSLPVVIAGLALFSSFIVLSNFGRLLKRGHE